MKHKLLLLPLVIGILAYAGFVIHFNGKSTHDYPPVPTTPAVVQPAVQPLRQDSEVVAVMQRLGLDYSKLNLIYGDNPSSTHDASFSTPNSLYITARVRPENLDILVSHEYLHYIQYTHRSEEQALYPSIESVMNTSGYLQGRIASYPICSSNCFTREDEAMAYSCTEMPDYTLPVDIVNWCNKYLPQRYSLPL